MHAIVRLLVVTAALLIGPSSGAAQQADVEVAVSETLAAWKAGNFASFASFYHPDTRGFFLDGGFLLRGFNVAALQAAYNAGFRADFELRDLDVKLLDDVALSVAYLDGTLSLPGGDLIEGTWRYSETRVLSEGTWKVVQYHFSEQSPPDGG